MVDKILGSINSTQAANAYQNSSNIADIKTADIPGNDSGVTFSEFLQDAAETSVDTMKRSEQMTAKAVQGEADLTEVVEAVTAAEITLQTVVNIRDRLVSAYQDIMRMPI